MFIKNPKKQRLKDIKKRIDKSSSLREEIDIIKKYLNL